MEKRIASIDINNEYTLIRQQFSTDESIENYWWIDEEHILVLSKEELYVIEKANGLDDWMGDNWNIVKDMKWARSDVINSNILRYMGTCANNQCAAFLTFEAFDDDTIVLRIIYFKYIDGIFRHYTKSIDITLKNVPLGEKVSSSIFNIFKSYDMPSAYIFLSNARISATIVDSKDADDMADALILSFAIDKALKQWSIVYPLYNNSVLAKQVVGYGFVGPNGALTGGEFPSDVIGSNGFNDSVKDINAINKAFNSDTIDGVFTCKDNVYGNATQQWYIASKINGIISHMTWDSNENDWIPVTLQLNNNYAASYASTSFFVNKILGFVPAVTTLGAMLPFDGIFKKTLTVLTSIFSPSIYYLTPAWTKFAFLQQSLGQYAYVHYNSNNRGMEATTGDSDSAADTFKSLDKDYEATQRHDELSFNEQKRKQKIEEAEQDKAQQLGGFFLALLTQGIASFAEAGQQLLVNATQGQQAVKDTGKKYSQFFLSNLLSATATDISIKGVNNAMSAEVTALKTLDMFYSTSANSKCYAGPGFVNHNFVAQCIAQGVSNRYINAIQNGMFTVLWPLSQIDLLVRTLVLELARDALYSAADKMAAADMPTVWGSGPRNSVSVAIGTAMHIGGDVIQSVINSNNTFMTVMPELIKTLMVSDNASFSPLGAISEHRIDIEGKHSYGAKNESFFWPCYGASNVEYTDEKVETAIKDVSVSIDFQVKTLQTIKKSKGVITLNNDIPAHVTSTKNVQFANEMKGELYSEYIYCKGSSSKVLAPQDMAVVEGCETFLPTTPFKNENIGMSEPVFTTPAIQDYVLDKSWDLGVSAIGGNVLWTFVKDTKVFDGECSNIVIYPDFCGIANPCAAVQLKRQIEKEYLRPWAITPDTIALNITGLNTIHNGKAYHSFDGIGQRIVKWTGSSGLDKQHLAYHYCFQINDHFKRSNILPPNQYLGDFKSIPIVAINSRDYVHNSFQINATGDGIINDIPGENKNLQRYSIPLFTETISTLPAVVKAVAPYKLNVVEGITSLTTDVRNTQYKWKTPEAYDFNIDADLYRATNEFICSIMNQSGVSVVKDLVAVLGMVYIGATPHEAYFYSEATQAYYKFTGGTNFQKIDTWNRFYDIENGKWDFVNQEVVFQCMSDMERLDERNPKGSMDDLFIARLDSAGVKGEAYPPSKTIYKEENDIINDGKKKFKILSMPGGLCFQGPNRFIVTRYIYLPYMLDDMKKNKGKWDKLPKEYFHPFRDYKAEYENIDKDVICESKGWMHNPFIFVTSPLGISEDVDCMFEWELTFTWTPEMNDLYESNEYACVNIVAQTLTEGGKKVGRPTHVYLTKELFTRGRDTGYYSFRFNSENGCGNREQLFIWSDSYIALCGLQLEVKPVTEKRNSQLTIAVDVENMVEM